MIIEESSGCCDQLDHSITLIIQVMVKQHGDVEANVSVAENVSKQLFERIDANLVENRTVIRKHATVVNLNASLAEEARMMQSQMKKTIEEVETYHERTSEYQTWLETSLQAAALKEPIGSETSVVKRQLDEVEVRLVL